MGVIYDSSLWEGSLFVQLGLCEVSLRLFVVFARFLVGSQLLAA